MHYTINGLYCLHREKSTPKSAPPCKKAERFMTMIIQKTGYFSNLPTIRLAFYPMHMYVYV